MALAHTFPLPSSITGRTSAGLSAGESTPVFPFYFSAETWPWTFSDGGVVACTLTTYDSTIPPRKSRWHRPNCPARSGDRDRGRERGEDAGTGEREEEQGGGDEARGSQGEEGCRPGAKCNRKGEGDRGDRRVRAGETAGAGGAGAERGRVTRRGAPLPSRLPGRGPRPGRSAGPGRLSSFLCCDPGVRPAPPLTTMEAEAEAVAETATAAVAEPGSRSRSQTGATGPASSSGFFLLHTRSPLRLRRLVQDRWFSAVRPETGASFRPERVGGNTQAAPGPPPVPPAPPRPAPPRPAPPVAAPPSAPLPAPRPVWRLPRAWPGVSLAGPLRPRVRRSPEPERSGQGGFWDLAVDSVAAALGEEAGRSGCPRKVRGMKCPRMRSLKFQWASRMKRLHHSRLTRGKLSPLPEQAPSSYALPFLHSWGKHTLPYTHPILINLHNDDTLWTHLP